MTDRDLRLNLLFDELDERILVLDGAMGTMLQQARLTAEDFGGAALEGCNENLSRTRPDVILDVHRAYLDSGADIIETNTFGSNRIVLAEYGLEKDAYALSRRAAELARKAAAEYSAGGRMRFVAGSMGPTTKAITVTGGVTFDELREAYYEQALGLARGGADMLVFETIQDTRNVKAGLLGAQRAFEELGFELPLILSCTIEPMGTMLGGQTADAFYVSVEHARPLAVGLNCGTGPEFMTDHIRTLDAIASTRISCYPNAGLPNEEGRYLETPESFAAQLERFVEHGWLNIAGGCCGTTPEHVRAVAQMVEGRAPRRVPGRSTRAFYSGVDLVEAEESNRPLLVGERTNVIGSRAFKHMIATAQWEEASEIARRQARNGAQIIDVCLQSSEGDELRDIPPFYERLIRKTRAPIMIDSTDATAVELALTYCQGKSIINSVNLEEGEQKLARVCPLARAYGAAVIAGCIDEDPEQAQAFTRERKLAVARRLFAVLTGKYGMSPGDIIIDPLVFPCATGEEGYIGGAVETIEAVRLIKADMPVKTVLGISNVSFGLPPAAREVVNSVFLYHCTKAGLDLAIVNAEKLERFPSIPAEERRLAEALLFNTPPADLPQDHPEFDLLRSAPGDWREQTREQRAAINRYNISAVTERFRAARAEKVEAPGTLPLDERLRRYIIEGTKEGLVPDLKLKLDEGARPLDIINGPLMAGMAEVGRLFSNNELIVAEVLQSAEAMKAAVAYLEQFMSKADSAARGRIMLATVKGDVHDIGKNLVEIILANNGYEVINLGIKVPPEDLIRAYHEHTPDAIGLSGLLVKSAHQMAATAADLHDAGVTVPVLVGGAALSERFTKQKIAPAYAQAVCYCKDAMAGLRTMNELMDPATREAVLAANTVEPAPAEVPAAGAAPEAGEHRSPKVHDDIPIPPAPYLDRKVRDVPQLAEVWSYLNPAMLYGRHLGFKSNIEKALAERDEKALELFHNVERVKHEAAEWMKVRAVWQFFEAERDGNSIHLFAPGCETPVQTFRFRRQPREDGLCLSDYVLDPADSARDHIALFVVTAGEGIRERAEEAKASGEFFKMHAIQALGLETAEAAAEWLHRRIREDWGFPDPPAMTMHDRFAARYRGKRYSFGYPACPDLEDQRGIFALLRPEEIGVRLTEGFMMDPEASVSALVFHHPDCIYFSVL